MLRRFDGYAMKMIANRVRHGQSGYPRKGFTIIELVLIISALGILSAIAVPSYVAYLERTKISTAILGISVIQSAIASYRADTGCYPSSLAGVDMDKMRDPWGNPYQYLKIADDGDGCGGSDKSNGGSGGDNSGGSAGNGATTVVKSNATASGATTDGGNGSGGSSGSGNNTANGQARKDRFLVPINTDYDLYSMGPDGRSVAPLTANASRDDIIRASDGTFIGRACDF
jgi:general secretion pathway protein G